MFLRLAKKWLICRYLDVESSVSETRNLSFKAGMCVAMRIHRLGDLCKYFLYGAFLGYINVQGDLREMVDDVLRFNDHVRYVIGRASWIFF